MGRVKVTSTRAYVKKSSLVKVKNGLYQCSTCGAFKKVNNKKK